MSKIGKLLFKSGTEVTDALKERGARQLWRLGFLFDVLFGLMLFQVFLFLPRPDVDHFDALNVIEILKSSYINYLVMLVGIVLILINWNLNNLQFGNLEMTDGRHSTISILHVICLMIYLYLVRLDMEIGTLTLILQLESIFLALTGIFSIWSWHYAVINGRISGTLSPKEIRSVYLKLMPEPIVSVLSFPFAWINPFAWSVSWLLLIPVSYLLKKSGGRFNINPVKPL